MKSAVFASVAAMAGVALATPTKTVKRATEMCGQWDSLQTGTYTLYNNLWGQADADSGSQCTTFNGLSGDSIAWSTAWSWSGGEYNVKSYANVVLNSDAKQLSAISSIPSTWSWSNTGSGVVADVAYDLFTSSSASGDNEYEIMIWVAAIGGAGPISSTGSAVASPALAGTTWDLYSGMNGNVNVYSFVAQSQVTDFNGDLMEFFKYLMDNGDISGSQYLTSVGAGTEPFVGSNAVLTVTDYSVSVQ
ncbi:family 12 glycosyl hydrolase [Xylariomycetidae sp. FL0641]|nr:family 12 glycosyl hydrolase [Xylariomycetidae sp. FL0641]